jgi:hypothetical protein
MLISRLIQLSLQDLDQPQIVLGVPTIFAVWSSLEVIAEQEPQIFKQILMERIQVDKNIVLDYLVMYTDKFMLIFVID